MILPIRKMKALKKNLYVPAVKVLVISVKF